MDMVYSILAVLIILLLLFRKPLVKKCRPRLIMFIQKVLINRFVNFVMLKHRSELIIGVDARPNVFGGYCVNLCDKSLDYYAIKTEDSPWPLQNMNDSRPSSFTPITMLFLKSEFGEDAKRLLCHFKKCTNAKLVDKNVFVNGSKDFINFAKYIQPADDFSRWEIGKGIEFLCRLYGIQKDNVRGTHVLKIPSSLQSKPWYDSSPTYNEHIKTAKLFARNFKCGKCHIRLVDLEKHGD